MKKLNYMSNDLRNLLFQNKYINFIYLFKTFAQYDILFSNFMNKNFIFYKDQLLSINRFKKNIVCLNELFFLKTKKNYKI